jgi:hypothetical protein
MRKWRERKKSKGKKFEYTDLGVVEVLVCARRLSLNFSVLFQSSFGGA